ncbi:MAG: hypothetical protein PHR15_07635 [Atopobiaceae bacterium]|jgi:hypothetical protein|nr:hypothetical protein [Atopobiaceae bacterium]MCH4180410.1 hypothetical protein [Atopobiaceae bacterium]MCH4214498.1 hypothetical protein [Atopobiaceae bacterium]MCH4230452.1 hypothetical protein [Atopobiaceae bacterium]MCH4276272.1 hypothetical protein [Atopobiaceae bacterium]
MKENDQSGTQARSCWTHDGGGLVYQRLPQDDASGELVEVSMALVAPAAGSLVLARSPDLVIAEVTRGSLTRSLFGSTTYDHAIVVGSQALAGLFASHRSVRVDQTLQDQLTWFFSGGEARLSDLMDLLDAARVPYGYRACTDTGLVSWRPPSPSGP